MNKTTLLFVLFCMSGLTAMEPEELMSSESSSSEQGTLFSYIGSLKKLYHNDLDMVIAAIKADDRLSKILNDESGNQLEFKLILYQLQAGRSETITTIAKKIGTPAAERYINLGEKLVNAVKAGNVEMAELFLKKGADVFFQSGMFSEDERTSARNPFMIEYEQTSPFTYAVIYGRLEMVKLLLPKVNPESIKYYQFHGYYPPQFETEFGVTGTEKDRKEIWRLINQTLLERYREQLRKGL